MKGKIKNLEWKSTDDNKIIKLTKKNSEVVSLPKLLAKEYNHKGSPAIISIADNKLRSKWHSRDLQGMQILYIFHLYLPPRREV
jgi:hypothetical protein